VLASASPRRRELLGLLGVRYAALPAHVDERAASSPALAKVEAVHRPGTTTLGADTEIDLDGARIGKPRSPDDALRILRSLAGRTHEVVTEVATVDVRGRAVRFAVRSRVRMKDDGDAARAAYVATGETADKAGAYAIQGKGAALVDGHDGCYANIVGLPLCHVSGALRRAGVVVPNRAADACQVHFAFACPVWRRAEAQGRALRDRATYPSF